MSVWTFKGGIHPKDCKELSMDAAIVELLPQGELVFPLSQHIGAPAKALVAVGDKVQRGQQLAEAGGFVSAPVHSSVSGIVTAIEPRFSAQGGKVICIIVENDNEYNEVEYEVPEPLETLSKEAILHNISRAGVVGMGGAGFPTHVKLSPKEPEKIEYVIANGVECEPYITADYRRMLENSKELVGGMSVILKLFDKAKGIFAIEDNKPECIKIMTELVKDEERMEVVSLKTKYPQGGERQLIYSVTRRALNSSLLPADVGCVVDNVETIIAIYNAVIKGRPLIERVTTVSGNGIKKPGNFKVHLGTNQRELLEAAGGYKKKVEKIIAGGPMMGFSMFTTDVPITKTSSSIICMLNDEIAKAQSTACINCGRCVMACPSRLLPKTLARISERLDEEEFAKCEGMECMECGVCSYVCPAKLPLKQSIASMRKIVLESRRKKQND